ncbi:hypothetical protein EYF80_023849 [Liparis tanakae]|uniref:Uncharacterized protein n=1 Tax=Liparis tanakae TaxID=230148 RepID=A0A4Z2HJN7_9TELE|nr:hypothetical protein EYF80_023849 [Liparis tanakae]
MAELPLQRHKSFVYFFYNDISIKEVDLTHTISSAAGGMESTDEARDARTSTETNRKRIGSHGQAGIDGDRVGRRRERKDIFSRELSPVSLNKTLNPARSLFLSPLCQRNAFNTSMTHQADGIYDRLIGSEDGERKCLSRSSKEMRESSPLVMPGNTAK